MKLAEIAQKLGCRIEGSAELEITGVAGLENAQPGQLTFLSNPKYRAMVETTRASAILLGEGAALRRPPGAPPLAVLRSENTYLSFAHAIALFYQPPKYSPGVHPTAAVASSARILRYRRPRHFAKRRHHWRRRFRLRPPGRRPLVQDPSVRPRCDRRRCRGSIELLCGSRDHRRNTHPARRKN